MDSILNITLNFTYSQIALSAASPSYAGYLTELDGRLAIQMGTSADGAYDEVSYIYIVYRCVTMGTRLQITLV